MDSVLKICSRNQSEKQCIKNTYVRKNSIKDDLAGNLASNEQNATMNSEQQPKQEPKAKTQPESGGDCEPMLCTTCPFCNLWFLDYRDVENTEMICTNCKKPFVAYDADPEETPKEDKNCSSQEACDIHDKKVELDCKINRVSSTMKLQGTIETIENLLGVEGKAKSGVKEEAGSGMKKGKDSTGCLEIASVTVANDYVAEEFKEVKQTALTDDSTSEDFHDFDLSRTEECFRVEDLWAFMIIKMACLDFMLLLTKSSHLISRWRLLG
ncbi:uncharacterized protein LOC113319636 [Papaver somniferum]|uniref:uncharacterized protein LOC113319636 n=1 Tax=Papaver somniferum TaxID=3469 RepID=UPI000E701811|nr:uncharacterized protein LOC113319636 [Papaver somniferum]